MIDSLLPNPEAKETDLFIVSDGPHCIELESKINEIRSYITSIHGFQRVSLIAHAENLGSFKSGMAAIKIVFDQYDKLIFLEDDNFVSRNFLTYMNEGLSYYNNNPIIFSVSGYNFPIKIKSLKESSVYFDKCFSGWGVGLWKQKWEEIDWKIDFEKLKVELSFYRKDIIISLGERVFQNLLIMCERKKAYGDAIICYHSFKTNKYSVFPVTPKVRNYGHDGLGEHGGVSDKYIAQKIDDGEIKTIFTENIYENEEINKNLRNYFRIPYKEKFKVLIKKHLFLK